MALQVWCGFVPHPLGVNIGPPGRNLIPMGNRGIVIPTGLQQESIPEMK
jgi:hypothetical protein